MFKVLEGRSYRLQHPWVGIVNRSQADINKNVDMMAARRKEQEYFETSPEYGHLAHKMGSEYLAKLLSQVIFHLLRLCFVFFVVLVYNIIESFIISNHPLPLLSFFFSAFGACHQAAHTKYHCFDK